VFRIGAHGWTTTDARDQAPRRDGEQRNTNRQPKRHGESEQRPLVEDPPSEVAEQNGVERPQAGRDPGVEREAPVMEGGQAARERGARSAAGDEARDDENRRASLAELDARPADSTTRVRPVEEAALGPPAAEAAERVRGRVSDEGAGCGCNENGRQRDPRLDCRQHPGEDRR
jgi:hypothetical protein